MNNFHIYHLLISQYFLIFLNIFFLFVYNYINLMLFQKLSLLVEVKQHLKKYQINNYKENHFYFLFHNKILLIIFDIHDYHFYHSINHINDFQLN